MPPSPRPTSRIGCATSATSTAVSSFVVDDSIAAYFGENGDGDSPRRQCRTVAPRRSEVLRSAIQRRRDAGEMGGVVERTQSPPTPGLDGEPGQRSVLDVDEGERLTAGPLTACLGDRNSPPLPTRRRRYMATDLTIGGSTPLLLRRRGFQSSFDAGPGQGAPRPHTRCTC